MDLQKESELLREIPIFSTLSVSQVKLLAFTSELFDYEDGDFLCRQGEPPDAIYVIMQGHVEVLEVSGETPLLLATMGPGDLIGEMAVLRSTHRSATVQAISSVRALKLTNERFLELITNNEKLALFVMNDLATKLADTNKQLALREAERATENINTNN